MVATTSHGAAVRWMFTRWKAGMLYLQGESCVIHTWALLGWGSHKEALYKCSAFTFISYRETLLQYVVLAVCLSICLSQLCILSKWLTHTHFHLLVAPSSRFKPSSMEKFWWVTLAQVSTDHLKWYCYRRDVLCEAHPMSQHWRQIQWNSN